MFNTSDLSQLAVATKTLRGEALEILAASPGPMTCHDIMLVSTLCPDRETLTREIYAMKKAGLVEPAGETTRPGTPRPVWLYRLSAKENAQDTTEPVTPLPSIPAEDKEKPMQPETKHENGKSVQQQVLDIIILEPGVTPDSIRKRFADKKLRAAADSAIYALRKAGRIERREEGGKVRLHPTAQAANKNSRRAPVSRSTPVAKLITGEEAKPLQQAGTHMSNAEQIGKNIPYTPVIPALADRRNALVGHLAIVASTVPPGVILGVFRDSAGSIEFTLDTKAGASFNVGGSLEDAVRCIEALAVMQPFAED